MGCYGIRDGALREQKLPRARRIKIEKGRSKAKTGEGKGGQEGRDVEYETPGDQYPGPRNRARVLTLQAIIAPSRLFDNGEFAEYYIVRPRTLDLDSN